MLRWRINTDTHTHTPAHYRAHPWASGRKEGRQTKGRIPHATLRTTLLVTGRLGESCTAECYFSPPLSVASSLCISLLPCLSHSSRGTRYLLAKRSLVSQRPRKGSLVLLVWVCVSHSEGCNAIIKASVKRWKWTSWDSVKYNVKTVRHELDAYGFYSSLLTHKPFFLREKLVNCNSLASSWT